MKNEALHAELKYEKKFKIEKKNIVAVMIIFNFYTIVRCKTWFKISASFIPGSRLKLSST